LVEVFVLLDFFFEAVVEALLVLLPPFVDFFTSFRDDVRDVNIRVI